MFQNSLLDVCAFVKIWVKACKESHSKIVRAKGAFKNMTMPIGKVKFAQVLVPCFNVDVLGVNSCGASLMS